MPPSFDRNILGFTIIDKVLLPLTATGTDMSTNEVTLLDSVVAWFARDPIGPLLNLPRIADAPPPELAAALDEQLALIPDEIVARTREDHYFQFFHSHVPVNALNRHARIWTLSQSLSREIPRRRLQAIQQTPPEIAGHPALQGVSFDDEGLVALDQFHPGNGVIVRRDHAFTIAPPVESCNATYWLTQALAHSVVWNQTRVRLDPFLFGPAQDFVTMSYRMRWWGKRCTWEELQAKTGRESGAWRPGPLTTGVEHTQYAWVTRETEGHLEIEELHKHDRNETRGTRYLHAIHDRPQQSVIHVDGAVRVLTDPQWHSRNNTHLKDLGKIGMRVKIFRIDGKVDESQLAPLCANFFVWNLDIARFFGAEISEEL